MKDVQARQDIDELTKLVKEMKKGQETFKAEIFMTVEAALKPVAVQAAAAKAASEKVEAQLQHLQEQLEVVAMEGNDARVELNALRESYVHLSGLLSMLIGNLKQAVSTFTISSLPDDPKRPLIPLESGLNRETRRSIHRGKGR